MRKVLGFLIGAVATLAIVVGVPLAKASPAVLGDSNIGLPCPSGAVGVYHTPDGGNAANYMCTGDHWAPFVFANVTTDGGASVTGGMSADNLYTSASAYVDGGITVHNSATVTGGLTVDTLVLTGGPLAPMVARGVITTDYATDGGVSVLAHDGLTFAAGDIVLFAGETTPKYNGLYSFGTVYNPDGGSGSASAPVTRIAGLPSGAVVPVGAKVTIQEGTLFTGTTWRFTGSTNAITIGTTSFVPYPERVTEQVTLVSGAATITDVPINSVGESAAITRLTAGGTTTLTIMYGLASLTPGTVGTVSLGIQAEVAAGTVNTPDTSALLVTITQ